MEGIDVSRYQGEIDWPKVKAAGIGFALLRAGYGRRKDQKDSCFERNYKQAKAAGLAVGCYWFSYAGNTAAALAEAEACLAVLKGRSFELGVWFDQEYVPAILAADNAQRTENVQTFLHAVEQAGYTAGLYCSTDWLKRRLNTCELTDTNLWIAQYASACTAPLMPCIWQYSSTGHVDGISGKVDRDVLYFAPHAPAQLQKELPCMPDLGSAGLQKGCRGPYAANLQKILEAIGLAPGGADGVFGYKTRAAVVAFQAQQGLQTDGIVGPATKAALECAWKKKQNAGA
jgi:GH25 family lysozyme M1 (1,4-beta-N-acetylmuramidase)